MCLGDDGRPSLCRPLPGDSCTAAAGTGAESPRAGDGSQGAGDTREGS